MPICKKCGCVYLKSRGCPDCKPSHKAYRKIPDKDREWTEVRVDEIRMLMGEIDKKWLRRIIKLKEEKGHLIWKIDTLFRVLWLEYPADRSYIVNVGYVFKIKKISKEYVGKINKLYEEGRMKV